MSPIEQLTTDAFEPEPAPRENRWSKDTAAVLMLPVIAGLVSAGLVIAGLWLLPPDLVSRLEGFAANVLAIAFVGTAVLHPCVRRGSFPLVMAIGLAEMIYRLPPLRELLLGQVEDAAQCWSHGLQNSATCRVPVIFVMAMAGVGIVLWLLARRILLVPQRVKMS